MSEFKHELGLPAVDLVSRFEGIIVGRAEHLFGCNRYLLQGRATEDKKVPDAAWVDEDSLKVDTKDRELIDQVAKVREPKKDVAVKPKRGGPMDKFR